MTEMYYRDMDDNFAVVRNEDEVDLFLHTLNSLHPSLRFTFNAFLPTVAERTQTFIFLFFIVFSHLSKNGKVWL